MAKRESFLARFQDVPEISDSHIPKPFLLKTHSASNYIPRRMKGGCAGKHKQYTRKGRKCPDSSSGTFVFKCKKSSRCLIQAIEQRGTDVGFFLSVLFFVGVTGKVWIMACWEGKIFEPDSQGSANAPFHALCSLVFNFAVLASAGPHMLMFGKFTGYMLFVQR